MTEEQRNTTRIDIGSTTISRTKYSVIIGILLLLIVAMDAKSRPLKGLIIFPLKFTKISSKFDPHRIHPIYKSRRPHLGTDFAAPRGTPVHVTADGIVIESGYNSYNGNYVFIEHEDNTATRYLHLQKRKVKEGDMVDRSEVIGTVGSTGLTTGPHLHYEFLVDGIQQDPLIAYKT